MRTGNAECLSWEQDMNRVYLENRKWRVSIIRMGNGDFLTRKENGEYLS
jgi:hypothetical protein